MMRCFPLLIALVPTLAAAQPTKPKPPLVDRCERPSTRQVSGAVKPGLHKLGELPPAKPIYTVVREIDGCPTPVSVRRR
jgi:hypothetical protein